MSRSMEDDKPKSATEAFEKAVADAEKAQYVLRLFIAGNTPKSVQAIENIRDICETKLQGRYTLEVIDIHQQPELLREEQILAAPTLVKVLPQPLRRIIGDLSDTERVLVGLNLHPLDNQPGGRQGDQNGKV